MVSDRELMRLLHGELEADRARELEDRIAGDPGLEARHRELAALWDGLESIPAEPVPESFSARLADRARRLAAERAGELRWTLAPAWARAGSVAALVVGLALGVSFGAGVSEPGLEGDQEAYLLAEPMSLAETFWLDLEETDGQLADGDSAGEQIQ